MIPKEKIDELRERVSIVQVVSDYLPLKKKGANWFGLCPFHSEKTPSFSVNEGKKIFYCFGCHETGSAITFVMKKEGVEFPEAVRTLASRFGVVIKEERPGAAGYKDSLYKLNGVARDFFARELKSTEAAPARAYLKKRGFDDWPLLKSFSMGFAPSGWEGLVRYLRKKGISLELAGKAGLVARKSKGYYDRFRSRIIFPITDVRGRVVGFGGRSFGDAGPKYLNTPETALFKKGETLFGFHQARESLKETGYAIIVEGYFDLMAMHYHGFTNTVATLGTAMSAAHLRALKGYTDSVYALFDADAAGRKASLRSLEFFLNEDMRCGIISLGNSKDPDEFLSANGPEAMREAVKGVKPLLKFYLDEIGKGFDLKRPEGKARYLEEAIACLARIKNVAERDHYAGYVAAAASIPASSVYEALGKKSVRHRRAGGGLSGAGVLMGLAALKGSALAEITILKVIVNHPGLYSPDVPEAVEAFKDGGLKEAGRKICERLKSGNGLDISVLAEDLSDEKTSGVAVAGLFRDDDGFIEEPEKMLKESLKKVMNRGKLKSSTEEMIKRLEESGRAEIASEIRARVDKDML
ncbi:MAG: DNA primase [Thermodesulfobacteriota bacterium]